MRWEDERYVRIYTRDTVDWLALGWEAQALFCLLLRKVDRAGIVDLGRGGVRGLAALLQVPIEVVERALPALVEDGCVERKGSLLVVRNFVEAQETPTSTAQRKRDQRERDRDLARATGFIGSKNGADKFAETERHAESRAVTPEVTPSHAVSQNVTNTPGDGHAESRAVTPNRAVPSVPSEPAEESLSSASAAEDSPPPAEPEFELGDTRSEPADEVLSHYVEAMKANDIDARKTPKRRKLVKARLKEGFTPEQLKQAINGLTWSDWHMGKDPKTGGQSFTDLWYCLRDAEHVEKFVALAQSPPTPPQRAGGWR